MKLKHLLLLASILLSMNAMSNPIDDVYAALEKNDRVQARALLTKAMAMTEYKQDAAMILMLLNTLEGKEENMPIMKEVLPSMENPSPYVFCLWFDEAVTNGYGKKDPAHLAFLQSFLINPKIHGSLKAATFYLMGLHQVFCNNFPGAKKYWGDVKSIKKWQLVGPFNNSSGSGFDKNYGPLDHPESDAVFISKTNAELRWFSPKFPQNDCWTSTIYHIPETQALCYAQSFVTSPADQDVVFNLGGYGSLKLWVNDQLVIKQEDERQTELDIYRTTVHLNKGVNRVLVQLGFTSDTQYPNFIVRITDENGTATPNLIFSDQYAAYTKITAPYTGKSYPQFAEAYFEQKVKEEPKNIINHILLAKAYHRSQRYNQAIGVLKEAQKYYPNNIILNYELLVNYLDIKDRTELLKQLEHIRNLDPSLLILAMYDFEENIENDNLGDAEDNLADIKKAMGPGHKTYLGYEIRLLAAKKEYQALYDKIELAYSMYPEHLDFLNYKFILTKSVDNASTNAVKYLEKYLKKNFESGVVKLLVEEYQNMGKVKEAEKWYLKMRFANQEDIGILENILGFYYNAKNYTRCMTLINEGLANAPYHNTFWLDRGYINMSMGKDQEAVEDFKKAIIYNPNLFEARENIRMMEGKKSILSYFRDTLVFTTIKKALKNLPETDDNYQYLFDDKNYIVFQEGASVEYSSFAVKVQNEAGIEYWKDVYVPYNPDHQTLVLEKAIVVKKNGQKVNAEENDSRMIFPSLEKGDVVYIAYHIENYTGGKLCKEFWLSECINGFTPKAKSRLRILTPKGYKFNTKTINIDMEPVVTSDEEFDMYDWAFENPPKCVEEDYMPSIYEVGKVINISTVDSWKTIADWYSDLAIPQALEDYNVTIVYDSIFGGKNFTTDYEKAKAIYDYMCKNIRYMHVSFRQSNHVPQKPMVTLSTQLGDCKDLATLFHTLAKKAGLKTHLVLVTTRDNGEETMTAPSIDFNHVIIRIEFDKDTLYQELTNSKLPFGSMPNDLKNAQALVVPNSADDNVGNNLMHIPVKQNNGNVIRREATVVVDGSNLKITTNLKVTGNSSSTFRHHFSGLTSDKLKEKIISSLNNDFENKLELTDYSVKDMDNTDSAFVMNCKLNVNMEVKDIGGMKAVKPPLFEEIYTKTVFTTEERLFPINYWQYESHDNYQTYLIIELPKDAKPEPLPANTVIKTKFIDYKLTFEKLPGNKVKITRMVKIDNSTIPAADYKEFRETIQKILKAEDVFIAFR